jgi:hypothetical protein
MNRSFSVVLLSVVVAIANLSVRNKQALQYLDYLLTAYLTAAGTLPNVSQACYSGYLWLMAVRVFVFGGDACLFVLSSFNCHTQDIWYEARGLFVTL